MENSYLQTTPPHSDPYLPKSIIPIAVGTILLVAGIFVALAAVQWLPHGVNTISSLGIWGYVAGASLIASGIITAAISCAIPSNEPPPAPALASNPLICDADFDQFYAYRKGNDKAFARAFGASFFFYNCDQVVDFSWGCAWRCMQICASAVNLFPSFMELFEKYRLDPLNPKEWAEPGYAKKYFDDQGIPSQLVLYNRERGTDKTPTALCEKMSGFPALREKLISHFKEFATPVHGR